MNSDYYNVTKFSWFTSVLNQVYTQYVTVQKRYLDNNQFGIHFSCICTKIRAMEIGMVPVQGYHTDS